MFGRRRKPKPGLSIGGVDLGWPDAGIAVSGSSGSGKTHSSRDLQRQIIRQDTACMVVACAKVDEADQVQRLCQEAGGL